MGYITHKGEKPLDRLALEVSEDGRKIYFYELKNGKWYIYNDWPELNNRKSNTLYFEGGWLDSDYGKCFHFSKLFDTYCRTNDDGYNDFSEWIAIAAEQAGR